MLMRGMHGTGKTTTAQAIAMAIQCSHINEFGDPCMVCSSCKSIIEERYDRDTHMLDGALLGTKEQVTETLNLVNIAPMQDPKRVYIIEEANQLSPAAINAFHKILEHPSDRVHFMLLYMTDVGKPIPVSIMSRCQVYNFKPFPVKETMLALKAIMVEEDIWEAEYIPNSFRLEGLAAIANASGGSFRDAIQYYERCIAGSFFTPEAIRENLGIIDESSVIKILFAFLEKDTGVWLDINRIDPMDVYSLGMNVLTSAMIYKSSRIILNEAFENQTKQLASHKNIENLYKALSDLGGDKTFLRRSELQGAFLKYWKMPEAIKIRTREIKK